MFYLQDLVIYIIIFKFTGCFVPFILLLRSSTEFFFFNFGYYIFQFYNFFLVLFLYLCFLCWNFLLGFSFVSSMCIVGYWNIFMMAASKSVIILASLRHHVDVYWLSFSFRLRVFWFLLWRVIVNCNLDMLCIILRLWSGRGAREGEEEEGAVLLPGVGGGRNPCLSWHLVAMDSDRVFWFPTRPLLVITTLFLFPTCPLVTWWSWGGLITAGRCCKSWLSRKPSLIHSSGEGRSTYCFQVECKSWFLTFLMWSQWTSWCVCMSHCLVGWKSWFHIQAGVLGCLARMGV